MRKNLFLMIGVILAAALGLYLGFTFLRPYAFHGTVLQGSEPVKDFTLTSMHGQPVKLSDFQDKIVVLYFGYTFCPDVCPTTLSEIKKALALLGPAASEFQVIMITVDPERDTPAVLNEYMAQFDPGFLGLTGTVSEIQNIAAPFGVYFAKQADPSSAQYLMEHTASVLVINRKGALKLLWPYGTPAADMADDLRYLLRSN